MKARGLQRVPPHPAGGRVAAPWKLLRRRVPLAFALAVGKLFLAVFCPATPLAAQEIQKEAPSENIANALKPAANLPGFRVEVETVLLNVAVASSGEMRQLGANDFQIFEDGVSRPICYFSKGDQSLSIVLLIDTSESMRLQALNEAKRAAIELTRSAHPDTEFALLTFDTDIRKEVDFTTDCGTLESALTGLTTHWGTRLFDGVRAALDLLATVRNRAKVVILLTDGKDDGSASAFSEVEDQLRKSDVTLFACGVYSPVYRRMFMNEKKYYRHPETDGNLNPVWVLKQLVSISGTQAYFPEPGDRLSAAFRQIALDLRQRYVIGFTPVPGGTSRFRSVKVMVKPPIDAVILHRPGYLR